VDRALEYFSSVTLPINWARIETRQGHFDFTLIDSCMAALSRRKVVISAGPLLHFAHDHLPEWLLRSGVGFEKMRELAYQFVSKVVARYAQVVHRWCVISGLNAFNQFNFNFEQILEMTRAANMAVRAAGSRAVRIVEVSSPWGEYYATVPNSIPPFVYMDMVVQSGTSFDAFGLQMRFGKDEVGMHLRDLVATILCETDSARLRLSSLEPWDLDAQFFSLWNDPRLCPHLHLPLQSGCAATLRRMARKTTPGSFRELVNAARQAIPEVAITTDIIAGFPGETDDEFRESLAFVEEMQFAGGHPFTYSPRPGTGAAQMGGQVPPQVRKERNARYRAAFEASACTYRVGFLDREVPVLWESLTRLDEHGWEVSGLTANYLRVAALAPRPLWNEISRVRLDAMQADSLRGTIVV
jgi:hypothetical protein